MKSIAEFFAKIQGKQAQKIVLHSRTKEIIKELTGIDLPIEAISFSGKSLILGGLDQASKSIVFIKKSSILTSLKEKIPNTNIADIRS